MIPDGWSQRTFGDCAVRQNRRFDARTAPDVPWVGLEHIGVGTLRLCGAARPADVAGPALLAEPGEVVFGRLRPYFRKVVRVQERLSCTGEAWVLSARTGVDPRFLFYLAANPSFVDACAAAASGTRMPRADWSFAAARPVLLPPVDEQRRVAAFLGTMDDRIDVAHAMNRTLEETARTLFASRFVGPVPPGWTTGGLDRVAEPVHDRVDPRTLPADVPWVGLEHLPRRSAALEAWGGAADTTSTKTRFQAGDILFGALRPTFHKVVPAPLDGVASTDILVLRPRSPGWRSFAFGHLSSDALIAHATAAADGTRMPRARWSDLCRYPVAIPPEAEAARHHAEVEPLFARIGANVRTIRTLATIRDTLLPRLLSGEVRVPHSTSTWRKRMEEGMYATSDEEGRSDGL